MTDRVLLIVAALTAGAGAVPVRLDVPAIEQAPAHCGPAALDMVLRYYGAPDSARARAAAACGPSLPDAQITDLARAAELSGYEARVQTANSDALEAALTTGTPPIVAFDVGFGSWKEKHYAVLVGWDPERGRYVLHDAHAAPLEMEASDFLPCWARAGSLALLVRERR